MMKMKIKTYSKKGSETLAIFKRYYTKSDIFNLFMIVAFPIHLWSIYLILSDIEWVAERTVFADAIGYASYSLVFALLESLILLIPLVLLGFLLPKAWNGRQRIAMLGTLFVVVSVWAIIAQVYNIVDKEPYTIWWRIIYHTQRFEIYTFFAMLLILLASAGVPAYFITRSEKWVNAAQAVIERLVLLSALYLVFDLIGLVIVIFRNL